MAYEIHIYRSDEIALEEWLSLCAQDQSIQLTNEISGTNPSTGQVITIADRNAAIWTSPESGQKWIFDYRRGKISFVHSDAALNKARGIAGVLGASLRGDEGEAY
jgi:hypothetical protein